MNIEKMKQNAAKAALDFIPDNCVLGVGTGSTANFLIDQLKAIKSKIDVAVSSSNDTTVRLQALGIRVLELNAVNEVSVYIDGADAYNDFKQLIKGRGGALTREKIIASASKNFICIIDASKQPGFVNTCPIPIEVIPMARSYVAREIVKLGGQPAYRQDYLTDNGNIILDIHNLEITKPLELESKFNQIAGVVCNGIFAARPADKIIIGTENSSKIF